ncbi:MAG: hypothetical protein KR126chlam3_01241 [Chlamydiae bacterium]|nr:hypothetical protein [Chlamydiota bacterium]
MQQLESNELEVAKNQLQEIIKPFQQEQNRRQKKSDFLKKCIRSMEKNDFFQVDELLKSKLAWDILEDSYLAECNSIFNELRKFADEQIHQYRVEFKEALLQLADAAELPLQVDIPRFSVLKGIEGKLDFANRSTTINQVILKSIDPKRIISMVIKIKCKLYDRIFEPQKFIDSLFQCYKKILKEASQGEGNIVPIRQLYAEYVWSLQSKAFFQNMDKGKFKGYAIDQFAVDLWRFFESGVSSAEGGYRIRLNSGRGSSLWLIDQEGEKRQITHALFVKN